MKVAIPADVQHIFGKQAFKQTLKTSDKAVAISRSGPLIAKFKNAIEEARGNPTQHLDEFLAYTQTVLRKAKADPTADPNAIDGIEDVHVLQHGAPEAYAAIWLSGKPFIGRRTRSSWSVS